MEGSKRQRTKVITEAVIVGYAMSRLDTEYLRLRQHKTWRGAYREAAAALGQPVDSFSNLRDEFDPLHDNPRSGWHQRQLRPNRQRILDLFHMVGDDAVMALVGRILAKEVSSLGTSEALETVRAAVEDTDETADIVPRSSSVAERLLTGRRAEDFFLQHSKRLVQVMPADILDLRLSAMGYDFGVRDRAEWAIEIKGLKQTQGDVQFTDREWIEAKRRRENYWLIVVANLAAEPVPKIIINPYEHLPATSTLQTSVSVVWRSRVV